MEKPEGGETRSDEERHGAAAKRSQVFAKLHGGHRSFLDPIGAPVFREIENGEGSDGTTPQGCEQDRAESSRAGSTRFQDPREAWPGAARRGRRRLRPLRIPPRPSATGQPPTGPQRRDTGPRRSKRCRLALPRVPAPRPNRGPGASPHTASAAHDPFATLPTINAIGSRISADHGGRPGMPNSRWTKSARRARPKYFTASFTAATGRPIRQNEDHSYSLQIHRGNSADLEERIFGFAHANHLNGRNTGWKDAVATARNEYHPALEVPLSRNIGHGQRIGSRSQSQSVEASIGRLNGRPPPRHG